MHHVMQLLCRAAIEACEQLQNLDLIVYSMTGDCGKALKHAQLLCGHNHRFQGLGQTFPEGENPILCTKRKQVKGAYK